MGKTSKGQQKKGSRPKKRINWSQIIFAVIAIMMVLSMLIAAVSF